MRIGGPFVREQVNMTYRVVTPLRALASRGHAVVLDSGWDICRPERLAALDAVLLWRACEEQAQRTARVLAEAGVGVVWDNDDDIASIPKSHRGYRQQGGVHGHRAFMQMVRMMRTAHVVTTPSAELADRYAEASGTDVQVLENYLPDDFGEGSPSRRVRRLFSKRRGGEIVIGWVAASEHTMDADQIPIGSALERLLERHDDVQVVTVGLRLDLHSSRYRYVPTMRYEDLPQELAGFDIGIAPLVDTRFNRARSNVKLKEYAANGAAWLASPIGPYAGMGEQQGGRLVADDQWDEALTALVANHRERERLARRAAEWAAGERIGRHAQRWEQALAEAAERARSGATTRDTQRRPVGRP
jgi:glycosyltransferase involved in cell wall biosynthesis